MLGPGAAIPGAHAQNRPRRVRRTTCVLVPTAFHTLKAGPKQVAKLLALDSHQLQIGDATVDVSADKGIIDPGGKVRITLTATSPTRQRIGLDVLVLQAMGSGGGRVDSPPVRVAREHVELRVAPDSGASKQLAFVLPGVRGYEMEGRMSFGRYTALVMPPNAADKLERLRRKAARVNDPMSDSTGAYGTFESAYYTASAPTSRTRTTSASPARPRGSRS
jgi:hypothetical protein